MGYRWICLYSFWTIFRGGIVEKYEQHDLNIDISSALDNIAKILETHQEMIRLLAKFVGMDELEEE